MNQLLGRPRSDARRFALANVLLGLTAFFWSSSPALAACGDVNGDGAFDASDLADYQTYLAEPPPNPWSPTMVEQCTVHGRGRTCDIVNAIAMARELDGSVGGFGLGNGCEDSDQDGIADTLDLCKETPAGLKPMDTVPGCATLDMASRPESLTEPAAMGLAEGARLLSSPELMNEPAIVSLRDLTEAAMLDMALAASDMRAGNVCNAADAYRSLLGAVESARAGVEDDRTNLRLGLEFAGPETPADHFGDGQLAVVALDVALNELDRGIETAQVAAEAFDRTCADVQGALSISGIVENIDDANSTLLLEDGAIVALAPGATSAPIGIGRMVDILGTDLSVDANTAIGIATQVTCDDCVDGAVPVMHACLDLKLAPLQAFAPFSYTPIERHRMDAYEGHRPSGDLELEQGMRLAVSQKSCDGISSTQSYNRYSMQLKIDGLVWREDVTPLDGPIDFPFDLTLETPHTLEATVRRQTCSTQNGCGPFNAFSPTVSYGFAMNAGGSLCDSLHAYDEFDLEDNDSNGFRYQIVQAFSHDSHAVQQSDNPFFRAQTCDGPSSSPGCLGGTIVDTPQNNAFKIWNDDFYPVHGYTNLFHAYVLWKKHGVRRAAGMQWPKVQGKRNGSTYSYACNVLPIVRDVVNFCSAPITQNSYYRYPLYAGGPSDPNQWMVSNGTSAGNPGHSGLQSNALDITALNNAQIRATRGGRVMMLKESSTPQTQTAYGPMDSNVCYQEIKTCFANAGTGTCTNDTQCSSGNRCVEGGCVTPGAIASCKTDYPCDNGNYIYVRHQDNTYATYWHMCHNCVTPVKGQILHRSDEIGGVGDTGNSTQDHLHYHVQTLNGIDSSWSIPQRYQTAASQAPDNLCQIPANGDRLSSSNDPADFY